MRNKHVISTLFLVLLIGVFIIFRANASWYESSSRTWSDLPIVANPLYFSLFSDDSRIYYDNLTLWINNEGNITFSKGNFSGLQTVVAGDIYSNGVLVNASSGGGSVDAITCDTGNYSWYNGSGFECSPDLQGSGGGNPFDQSLNMSDGVSFGSLNLTIEGCFGTITSCDEVTNLLDYLNLSYAVCESVGCGYDELGCTGSIELSCTDKFFEGEDTGCDSNGFGFSECFTSYLLADENHFLYNGSLVCTANNGLCTGSEGGGNPFDQSLNTTDDVSFGSLNLTIESCFGTITSCDDVTDFFDYLEMSYELCELFGCGYNDTGCNGSIELSCTDAFFEDGDTGCNFMGFSFSECSLEPVAYLIINPDEFSYNGSLSLGDVDGVSLVASGNITAAGFNTLTDVYSLGDSALKSIKPSSFYVDSKSGLVDHKSFGYSYTNFTVSEIVGYEYVTDNRTECDFNFSNKKSLFDKSSGTNCREVPYVKKQAIFVNKTVEAVNLVKEVALLKQAVYELKEIVCKDHPDLEACR